MIVHLFPEAAPHRHPYRRLCSFAPASLHVYRRALIRRIGLPAANRPAAVLDAVARALLQARVS
jgi:hypothetical protein